MTPEEQQRMMNFILESQANSVVRMDRLEEDQKRHEQDQKRHEENQKRHEENQLRFEENQRKFDESMAQMREGQKHQKETLDGLLQVTNNLVKISENAIGRIKRLESRSDSADETLKVLRELLEANLRRPDNSPTPGE